VKELEDKTCATKALYFRRKPRSATFPQKSYISAKEALTLVVGSWQKSFRFKFPQQEPYFSAKRAQYFRKETLSLLVVKVLALDFPSALAASRV